MNDLRKLLQVEFVNYAENIYISELTITISHMKEFDYQTMITKLVKNEQKNELLDFLLSNEKINNIFSYEFTNTEKLNFLCFKIKKEYMNQFLQNMYSLKENEYPSFFQKTENPKSILFDYSSPNMAKDMHVGHLRSTIIGDVLANIYEHIGHNVIRVNHLGDYGLPFGMIVEYVISKNMKIEKSTSLQEIYVEAKKLFDSDKNFSENAYLKTKELQLESNEIVTSVWKNIYHHSLSSYNEIYKLLGISKELKVCGESFYTPFIEKVKSELKNANIISIDECGRTIVSIPNKNPMIFEKSEEKGQAYTYDTTDIVTLWYRTQILKTDEIYYVVDTSQSYHFNQLFDIGKLMNWTNNKNIKHINFGIISLEDGSKISSRLGNTPRLIDLINKGVEVTIEAFNQKNTKVDDTTILSIAIGSIKYYDLSKSRLSNYKFDFKKMLQTDGNTYMYIIYSIARCKSVLDKLIENNITMPEFINFDKLEDIDYKLLRKICEFPTVLDYTINEKMPHYICDYMYKLSSYLHENYSKTRCINFDSNNKIININEPRIVCYSLVNLILKKLFEILGLPVVEKV